MDQLINYLSEINPVLAALYASTFTWLVTALGAAFVFFFKTMNRNFLDSMLGFTGGVMLAASLWSSLSPVIGMCVGEGCVKLLLDVFGFLLGTGFLFALDKLLPHFHVNFKQVEGVKSP